MIYETDGNPRSWFTTQVWKEHRALVEDMFWMDKPPFWTPRLVPYSFDDKPIYIRAQHDYWPHSEDRIIVASLTDCVIKLWRGVEKLLSFASPGSYPMVDIHGGVRGINYSQPLGVVHEDFRIFVSLPNVTDGILDPIDGNDDNIVFQMDEWSRDYEFN